MPICRTRFYDDTAPARRQCQDCAAHYEEPPYKLTTSRKHICPECQDKRDRTRRTTKRAAAEVRAGKANLRTARARVVALTDITRYYESTRRTIERQLDVVTHKNLVHTTTRRRLAMITHTRYLHQLDLAFALQLRAHMGGGAVNPLSEYFYLTS